MTDPALLALAAMARQRTGRGRSAAYLWLRKRYRRLAAEFRTSRPPWDAIASAMSEAGVQGGRGAQLTGHAVMRIWARVCRDVAADAGARSKRSSSGKVPMPQVSSHWRPAATVSAALVRPQPTGPPQQAVLTTRREQLDDLATILRRRSR